MGAGDLRHAYAVLELSPPVTEARLKHRYKALVRRWHPDRFQADPTGQAEASQRLREINIAYDLLSASLTSREPEPLPSSQPEPVSRVPPVIATDQTFWPPERVDAIVDSINRMNRISLAPGMTVQRWLSVGVVVVYLAATIALLPRREINRVLEVSFYLLLPLSLIWRGESEDRSGPERWVCWIFGWLFMAAPAVVAIVIWRAA